MTVKKVFIICLNVAIVIFFIWLIFRDFTLSDFEELKTRIIHFSPTWAIVFFALAVISQLARVFRWMLMFRGVDEYPSFGACYKTIMIGFGVTSIATQIGEITKPFVMSKLSGVKVHKAVAVVVVDKLIDMLSIVACFVIVLFVYEDRMIMLIPESFQSYGSAFTTLLKVSCLFLISFIMGLIFFPRKVIKIIHFLPENLTSKIEQFTLSYKRVGSHLSHLSKAIPVLGLAVLTWFCYVAISYSIMEGMGNIATAYGVSLWDAMFITVAASMGFLLSPGGIGSHQYIVSQILILFFLLPNSEALSFGFIYHASVFIGFSIPGMLVLVVVFGFRGYLRIAKEYSHPN